MSESQPTGFFAELRRRGVLRVLAVYLASAWVVIEVSETTFPRLGLPDWVVTALVWTAVLLLPMVAGGAWVFQVEDGRVRRDLRATPRRARAVARLAHRLDLDSAAAAAYRHYVNLRTDPEPVHQARTDSARARLAALEHARAPERP